MQAKKYGFEKLHVPQREKKRSNLVYHVIICNYHKITKQPKVHD